MIQCIDKNKEKVKKDEKRNERRQSFIVIKWLDFLRYLKKYSYEVLEECPCPMPSLCYLFITNIRILGKYIWIITNWPFCQ